MIQPALIRSELPPMLRVAVPVVLAELGWMSMGVVDTIMVGPLGPAAIAAAGVGTSLHMAFAIFGMGLLLGLDTLVSQAYGAGQITECHRWLIHGVVLALLLATPVMLVCFALYWSIPLLGFHGEVLPLLESFFAVIIWSTPSLLLYAAFRRYLQGIHLVGPITFALVSANLVNAALNWAFIYGHAGFPAMGVAGSAWATFVSRAYMAAVLLIAIVVHDRWRAADLRAARDPTSLAASTHRPGLPRGVYRGARSRRLRRRHGARRASGAGLGCLASDRAQYRRRFVHGAVGPGLRRRCSSRTRGRRWQSASSRRGGLDGRSSSVSRSRCWQRSRSSPFPAP